MLTDPFHPDSDGYILQGVGFEIELERRRISDLTLPTGRLVACDPLTYPESDPFEFDVPTGTHAVHAIIAHLRDRREIAYISVEFQPESASRWQVAHVDGEEQPTWQDARSVGFPVESGVGALMDESAANFILDALLTEDGEEEFTQTLHRGLSKTRRGVGFGAGGVSFGLPEGGNAVVFEVDDGLYTSYRGSTPDGVLTRFVVDLGILDLQFTPYGMRKS